MSHEKDFVLSFQKMDSFWDLNRQEHSEVIDETDKVAFLDNLCQEGKPPIIGVFSKIVVYYHKTTFVWNYQL